MYTHFHARNTLWFIALNSVQGKHRHSHNTSQILILKTSQAYGMIYSQASRRHSVCQSSYEPSTDHRGSTCQTHSNSYHGNLTDILHTETTTERGARQQTRTKLQSLPEDGLDSMQTIWPAHQAQARKQVRVITQIRIST